MLVLVCVAALLFLSYGLPPTPVQNEQPTVVEAMAVLFSGMVVKR